MTVYKYLPSQYADRMLSKGEFLFRSLSYFRDLEKDGVRQDNHEGILSHRPVQGLEINNPTTGETLYLPHRFESVAQVDQIFVACFSTELSSDLAAEFGADACIEITNVIKLVARVRGALRLRSVVDRKVLPFGLVEYRTGEEPPVVDWALPEKIVMLKRIEYSRQKEFRIAFAEGDAFAVENVALRLQCGEQSPQPQREQYPQHLLKLGDISKFGQLHLFS